MAMTGCYYYAILDVTFFHGSRLFWQKGVIALYNIFSAGLFLSGLAVPMIGIAADLRRKLWPAVISVCCCCGFLLLQIGIRTWRLKSGLSHGFSVISESVHLVSKLTVFGTVAASVFYILTFRIKIVK